MNKIEEISLLDYKELLTFLAFGIHTATIAVVATLIKYLRPNHIEDVQDGLGLFGLIGFGLGVVLWVLSGFLRERSLGVAMTTFFLAGMFSFFWYLIASSFGPISVTFLFRVAVVLFFICIVFGLCYAKSLVNQTEIAAEQGKERKKGDGNS